jgi:hypothetical protein
MSNTTNLDPTVEATGAPDSTPVDEQALAALLTEYVATPVPVGTFDGESIELTDENISYIYETAAAAGRGLTVKGDRRQHYMTFSPPLPGTKTVWIASTPPETPPRGPTPLPAQITAATAAPTAPTAITAPVRSDGPVATPPVRAADHIGSGIRKRPYKCGYCMSTFASFERRTEHVQRTHANRLASSATSSAQTALTEEELFN